MGSFLAGVYFLTIIGILVINRPIICFFNPGDDFFFFRCPRRRTPNPSPTTPAPTPTPGPFNIRLINMGDITEFDGEVEEAAQRWERVITNDQPDVSSDAFNVDMFDGFFFNRPALLENVDDLTIGYDFRDLGNSATFGRGGPIYVRLSTGATITGAMSFDFRFFLRQTASVNIDLITHQIGHILGIGTLWRNAGCINTCFNEFGSTGPYECSAANTAYSALNLGVGDLLVDRGCMHFAEESFPGGDVWSEVMTPVFNPNVQQLITTASVASLTDVAAYEVDLDAADPIPASGSTARTSPIGPPLVDAMDLTEGLKVTTEPIPLDV